MTSFPAPLRDFERTTTNILPFIGAGYTGAIGDSDRWRVFGYGSGALGARRSKEVRFNRNAAGNLVSKSEDTNVTFSWGVEFFAGITYEAWYDLIDVAFRYRASVVPESGGATNAEQFNADFLSVVHGPEFSLRIRF